MHVHFNNGDTPDISFFYLGIFNILITGRGLTFVNLDQQKPHPALLLSTNKNKQKNILNNNLNDILKISD